MTTNQREEQPTKGTRIMTEPTKDEIADVFNSLMSTAHSCGAIYGTPTKIVDKVIRHWVQNSKDLVIVTEQLADAQKILAQCLSAMPCGYVPNHTVENLPDMISDQTTMFAEEITYSEKLEKQRDLLIEVLEITLNATVLNHRRERWHSDAEYALNKIKLNK